MNRAPLADYIIGNLLIFSLGIFLGAYFQADLLFLWPGIDRDQPSTAISNPSSDTSPDISPVPNHSRSASNNSINLPFLDQPLSLVYSETLEEAVIQQYLHQGAVILPLGISFGEPGNVVITAHSSGPEDYGPYRDIFAKLSELDPGDEYTITTPTAVYIYKIYDSTIVEPDEVNKLPSYDERSTVTLVTCWPVGSNSRRLLVNSELVNIDFKI